jgi:hypothetical protein
MDWSDKPMISPKDVKEPQPAYSELPADFPAELKARWPPFGGQHKEPGKWPYRQGQI